MVETESCYFLVKVLLCVQTLSVKCIQDHADSTIWLWCLIQGKELMHSFVLTEYKLYIM